MHSVTFYLFIYLLTYFIRVPVQLYTALPQGPIITNKIHHCKKEYIKFSTSRQVKASTNITSTVLIISILPFAIIQ